MKKLVDRVFKGWNARIYISLDKSTWNQVGFAESVTLEIATGVEPYYGIGKRVPETLVEGNEEITGSLSRAWVNIDYLTLLGSGGVSLTNFHLVFRTGEPSGNLGPYCYVYDCKFETGSLDIPQDGFLTEDYDFRAISVAFKP